MCMMKLNKIAALVAATLLSSAAMAQAIDNWRATDGTVWKNGTNEYCWRDNFWTPATGVQGCDGVPAPVVAKPAPAPVAAVAPAPVAAPAPAPVAAPAPAPMAPAAPVPAPVVVPAPVPVAAPAPAPAPAPVAAPEKVSFAADAYFDTDKADLKKEGQAKLADMADKVKGLDLEVVIAVGHTDSQGSAEYNQKLSIKRADAVKGFLASKGISAERIYTEGKGMSQPVADNKSADGRTKNRRVEVEVVGTRK
jgi:OOP family OmpA-OmpF porin